MQPESHMHFSSHGGCDIPPGVIIHESLNYCRVASDVRESSVASKDAKAAIGQGDMGQRTVALGGDPWKTVHYSGDQPMSCRIR